MFGIGMFLLDGALFVAAGSFEHGLGLPHELESQVILAIDKVSSSSPLPSSPLPTPTAPALRRVSRSRHG